MLCKLWKISPSLFKSCLFIMLDTFFGTGFRKLIRLQVDGHTLLFFSGPTPNFETFCVSFSEMVQVGLPPKTTTSRGKTNSRTLHLPEGLLEEDTFLFWGSPGNPEIIKEYHQSDLPKTRGETHRNYGAKFGSLITHNLASGKR